MDISEVKMAQLELGLVGALLCASIIPWFYKAFAVTVFVKNNALVSGYGEHYEIIYICVSKIQHVWNPLIPRLGALHALSILGTLWGRCRREHMWPICSR